MRLSVSFEGPGGEDGGQGGPVTVGWFLDKVKAGIVYFPPEKVRSAERNRAHAKSASRCPAVVNLESRYALVRCPFDLNIGFARDAKGKPALRNLSGDLSPIRAAKLSEKLHLMPEAEWRHPDVPVLQLSLPYVFVADLPVYASQVAPFMHYRRDPLPGTVFGGRYPIHVWPRPLMWAFEWHDTDRPIRIARGEPLFYLGFETLPQERGVALVETEVTPGLAAYMELISGAVNYVNQTFSLFEAAEARRPATLLSPVRREGPGATT